MELVKAKFTFNDWEDFPKFEGYYDPAYRYWNGWACPYFTKKTRDEFIKYEEKLLDDMDAKYLEENKEFLQDLYDIKSEMINGVELFYFGGFLCWDEVDEND